MERSLDDQNRALAFVCNLLRDTSQHGRGQSPTSSRRNLREYQGLENDWNPFRFRAERSTCLGRDERDKLLKALGSIAEISELTNVKKVTISQMLVRR